MEPWMKEVVDFVNYRPEVLDPWCPGVTVEQIRKKCKRDDLAKEKPQWLQEFNERKWVLPKSSNADGDDQQSEMFRGMFCSKETKDNFSWVHKLLVQGEKAVMPEHDVSTLMKHACGNPAAAVHDEVGLSRSFKKIPARERRIQHTRHHIEWGKDFSEAMEEWLDRNPTDVPPTKRPRWLESIQPSESDDESAEGTGGRELLTLAPVDGLLGLGLNGGDTIRPPRGLISLNVPQWELSSQLDRITRRFEALSAPLDAPSNAADHTDSIPSVCFPSVMDAVPKTGANGYPIGIQPVSPGNNDRLEALAELQVGQLERNGELNESIEADIASSQHQIPCIPASTLSKTKGLLMSDFGFLDGGGTQGKDVGARAVSQQPSSTNEARGKDLLGWDFGDVCPVDSTSWERKLGDVVLVDANIHNANQMSGNVTESEAKDFLGCALPGTPPAPGGSREGKGSGRRLFDTRMWNPCEVEDGVVESSGKGWLGSILPGALRMQSDGCVDGASNDSFKGVPDTGQVLNDGVQGKGKDVLESAMVIDCRLEATGVKGTAGKPSTGPSRHIQSCDGAGKDEGVSMAGLLKGCGLPLAGDEANVIAMDSSTSAELGACQPRMGGNGGGLLPSKPAEYQSQGHSADGGHAEGLSMSSPGAPATCQAKWSSTENQEVSEVSQTGELDTQSQPGRKRKKKGATTGPKPAPSTPSDNLSKTTPAVNLGRGKRKPAEYNLMKETPTGSFLPELDIYVKVKPLAKRSPPENVAGLGIKHEERRVTGILVKVLEEVKAWGKDQGSDWLGGEDPFLKVEGWLTSVLATNPLNHKYLPRFKSTIVPEDIETLKGIFDGKLEAYLPCMAKWERERKAFWMLEKACLYPRALKGLETHKEVGQHQLQVIISLRRARARRYPKTYDRIDTVNLFDSSKEELLFSDSNIPNFTLVENLSDVEGGLSYFGRIRQGSLLFNMKRWELRRAVGEEENFLPLSEDPTAKKLADQIGAELVIAGEALSAFASVSMNPKCGVGFEIPFSSSPAFASEKLGKRLVIDAPLLGRKLSQRERDSIKYEAFCLDTFCRQSTDPGKVVVSSYHYSHWSLDGRAVLVRRLDRIRVDKSRTKTQCFWVKPEYLEGLEETFTEHELLGWWMEDHLRGPATPVVIQRIDVLGDRMMKMVAPKSSASIIGIARRQGMRIKPRQTFSVLQRVINRFSREDPGSFLLTHCPGHMHSTLYVVVNSDNTSQRPHPPLPVNPTESTYSGWFDLHKAHENSGELDESKDWFLPPNAVNYFADMPGIFPRELEGARNEHAQMAV